MIYKNIEFFNVEEIEIKDEYPGIRLHRFPKKVEVNMGWGRKSFGRWASGLTTGCEIRFVTEGDLVEISLSALEAQGEVLVYKGDFFHSKHTLKVGVVNTLVLRENPEFKKLDSKVFQGCTFSPNVWRIIFCHNFTGVFYGINDFGYTVRPPKKLEIPNMKWMAYGSSITHGAGALTHTNSYIMQAARGLKVDVLDKGMGGSCLCENEVADFLALDCNWDFATLELGVNMRESFTPDEFEEFAHYLITTIKQNNPFKHIFLVTIYPNSLHYINDDKDICVITQREFDIRLRKIYSELEDDYLHLIEGSQILKDFSYLTCDLIHPSEFGHIAMGESIAHKIKQVLFNRE